MMKQIVYFLAFASSASALSLTPDTWDEHTSGKSVFIKFFAPCKSLMNRCNNTGSRCKPG
jgi:hypothetical protein